MIPYWQVCAKPFTNLLVILFAKSGTSKVLLFLVVPAGAPLQQRRVFKGGVPSLAAQLCSFPHDLVWCWQVCTGPAWWKLSWMKVSHPCPGTVGIPSWAATKGCLAILSWLLGFRFAGFVRGQWILAVPASSFHVFCWAWDVFPPGGSWAGVGVRLWWQTQLQLHMAGWLWQSLRS